MTAEEHVRLLIGNLVITVATLTAEVEALRAQLPPVPPPAPAPGPEDHMLPADWKLP